mmetsp:Transcript_9770/g.25633  ORF Transcript_9770/g.25633 Transcript_9770/m.25633 type:complete len:583 (+) Transcript_9770:109-1857(+)
MFWRRSTENADNVVVQKGASPGGTPKEAVQRVQSAPAFRPRAAPPPSPKGSSKGKAPPPPPRRGKGAPLSERLVGPPPKAGGGASGRPFARRIHWKTLDVQDPEGTIFWDDERPRVESCGPRFDTAALGRMLDSENDKRAELQKAQRRVLSGGRSKGGAVRLLGDQRATAVAVVLRILPLPTVQVAQILQALSWEEPVITADILDGIPAVLPSSSEAMKLRDFASPEQSARLRDTERALVPFAFLERGAARAKIIGIAWHARARLDEIKASFAELRETCTAIQRSKTLQEVLLAALDLGNYVNHGDSSKGARAIAVSSLLQLKDQKVGKASFFHFLCASLYFANTGRDAATALTKELERVVQTRGNVVQNLMTSALEYGGEAVWLAGEMQNFGSEYRAGSEPEGIELPDLGEFFENPLEIRGAARERLARLGRLMGKLNARLQECVGETAECAERTLRYFGVVTEAMKLGGCACDGSGDRDNKKVLSALEVLLKQLSEFLQVFSLHWRQVQIDLPYYGQLFRPHSNGATADKADAKPCLFRRDSTLQAGAERRSPTPNSLAHRPSTPLAERQATTPLSKIRT